MIDMSVLERSRRGDVMIPYERVAREAARLRYDESESYREYYHAKREAARRLGFDVLPANKDIFAYYQEIADFREGKEARVERLRQMREEALEWMKLFEGFTPRLLGSVKRGDVTAKSDIDLHVLVEDDYDDFIDFLDEQGIKYDYEIKEVRDPDEGIKDYHHVYVKKKFKCEITIYLINEYCPQTCSIFGEKIKGLTTKQLARLIEKSNTD